MTVAATIRSRRCSVSGCRQIEQLSAIDEQLNQRKLNGERQP